MGDDFQYKNDGEELGQSLVKKAHKHIRKKAMITTEIKGRDNLIDEIGKRCREVGELMRKRAPTSSEICDRVIERAKKLSGMHNRADERRSTE